MYILSSHMKTKNKQLEDNIRFIWCTSGISSTAVNRCIALW